MKKAFKIGVFTSSAITQTIIFVASIFLIFAASYIVGYRYLQGNTFWGNDSFSYFSVVNFFNNYFPKLPFWFPQQGGGISLLAGYPWFAAFLVIILERLSQFDLVQSFRLLGFLSVPLTGVGVFVLAWTMLNDIKPVWMRQVIGLIAALFYVASPIAWIWLVRWGFYSENVSHLFVPFAIIFFDIFIDRLANNNKNFIFRLSLFLSILFLTLGTLTHFFVAAGLIPVFGLLVLLKFKRIKSMVFSLILFATLFLGLFAFRLYPYQRYNKQVAVGGFTGYAAPSQASYEETAKNMLPPMMMLSLEMPRYDIKDFISFSRSTIADMTFPFYVWVLCIPALIFSFFKSKKIFILSIYNLIGFFLNSGVNLRLFLGEHLGPFTFLLTLTTGRVFFIAMGVIIPILAGYGAYVLWGLISDLLSKLFTKIKPLYYLFYPFQVIAVFLLTVITAGYAVNRWYNLPYDRAKANIGAFNDKVDLRDIWHKMPIKNSTESSIANFDFMSSLCLSKSDANYPNNHICSYFLLHKNDASIALIPPNDLVVKAQKECIEIVDDYCDAFYKPLLTQLKFDNWEKFKISADVSGELAGLTEKFKELPSTPYRFDMSGYTGRYIMATPLVTNNSLIQTYINTLSLIYNLWNYQSQSMYTQFPLYEKPGVLSEIARWFGINYVFLTGAPQEPLVDYEKDSNWGKIGASKDGWMKFNDPVTLATWDNRPRILVISDNSKYFYNQTFKFFTWGALPYKNALPIIGRKEVDSYSLKELQKFDAIFMRGYDYKFKPFAYNLLNNYVKNGGKLIFDTGWQYLVPDYKIKNTPEFMPFTSLSWKNLKTDSNWSENDFAPLTWEDTSWGVSVPDKVKPWAKTILTYANEPLAITGNYGKGSVLWFGFNIIPHAEGKDSLSEVLFFSNAVDQYILGTDKKYNEFSLEYERVSPDKIRLKLNEDQAKPTNIYFRESYYPDWKAKLISNNKSKNIKIYAGGPGFMVIEVPSAKKGDIIEVKIIKPFKQIFMELVSLLTFLLLVVGTFMPKIFKTLVVKIPRVDISKLKNTIKIRRPKFTNDDDDY